MKYCSFIKEFLKNAMSRTKHGSEPSHPKVHSFLSPMLKSLQSQNAFQQIITPHKKKGFLPEQYLK
jgi:hypothetical protein